MSPHGRARRAPDRSATLLAAALSIAVVMVLATACSSDDDTPDPPAPATPSAAPAPPEAPAVDACYRIGFDAALAPTTEVAARSCDRPHTSQTYHVATLDTVIDGHLLAVDAERVQEQVADACPAELGAFVGGTEQDLRLSMIRPVWFTPTVEESDTGADWYRCDAVVVAGASSLARREGSLEGVLDRDADRESVAMCGTAAPDDEAFVRVPCASDHRWRAITVVDIAGDDYPGADEVRQQGQAPCEDAAGSRAEDPLDFQWGYEWPTAEQWAAGMTFGRCWAPD